MKHVNELINKNINRFNENDLLDLKVVGGGDYNLIEMGFSKMQISKAKNIYLLSERGYTKLVSMMDNNNDMKWQIMDSLIDEYFAMRQVINSIEQKKANLLLSIYNGGQDAVLSAKELTEIEVEEATRPLLDKIEEDEPKVSFADAIAESKDSIDVGSFAKVVKDEEIFLGGRTKLFQWLKQQKFLTKDNLPYQKYIDQNIFEVQELCYRQNGVTRIYRKTLITGKGQIYLVKKLKESQLNN